MCSSFHVISFSWLLQRKVTSSLRKKPTLVKRLEWENLLRMVLNLLVSICYLIWVKTKFSWFQLEQKNILFFTFTENDQGGCCSNKNIQTSLKMNPSDITIVHGYNLRMIVTITNWFWRCNIVIKTYDQNTILA